MKRIRVGAAVLNQTPLDWDGNLRRIQDAIAQAREAGVSVLCLPELAITGYGCEDTFHAPAVLEMAEQLLAELLPETRGMAVSLGLPVMVLNSVFDAVCLVVDGRPAGVVAKQYLAGDGVHYEPRWFKPWRAGVIREIELAGEKVPIGDLHFDCGGVRIGFEICEDAWVASRPGGNLSRDGVDLLLNPSASHFALGKAKTRERFVLEGSRAFGVSYVYTNLVGNEAGRVIYDGGAFIASAGEMIARGPRLTFSDVTLTHAVIDVSLTRTHTARTGSFRPDISEHVESRVEVPFAWPVVQPDLEQPELPLWEASEFLKEEEFTRAEVLGLFDYLRKSYSQGFVVSLSGGADSTACVVLIRLMVEQALQEIGLAGLRKKLANISGIDQLETPSEIVARLLTTVYQSTRNSGNVTRNAAREVAEAVGARHLEFDVDDLVQGYRKMVGKGLGAELNWQDHDVALQNIQARARSPGVWMLANIENALLISTSNRSEAAVGYATMDGDTSGGIAPIAGIDKNFLRQWLRWMEASGPEGLGAIPAVAVVNVQQPTAELRPKESHQTDEGDLMPYSLLDDIEGEAIREKRSPVEVYQLMREQHPEYETSQLRLWVTRFFRLWARNQWKRERYAPSFHLDDKNLDPRSWCRFPILSGAFRRELRDLEEFTQ
jgi:NAD+ synthase (glutamine-hydrolysing)